MRNRKPGTRPELCRGACPPHGFRRRLGNGEPRRRGLTLVELSFVVLISATLLAVAAIRLGRSSMFVAESERAARRLAADLRYAHSEAIATAKNYYLLFTDGGAKYTAYAIYRVEAGGDVQVEPARVLSDHVALTGSATRAEFEPSGSALAGYTYTVTSPGGTYSITVTLATGAVTIAES